MPTVAAVALALILAISARIALSSMADVDDVDAEVVGEGDPLQPPSAGRKGQADGGDEEEQGGEAATHRAIVADACPTLRA